VNKIDDILAAGGGKRTVVGNALEDVKSKLLKPDKTLEDDIGILYSVRKHIGDLFEGRLGGEKSAAKYAKSELMEVRNILDDRMRAASGDWKTYLEKYREMSKPIHQMEEGQRIASRTANASQTSMGDQVLSQSKWGNVVTKNKKDLAKVMTKKQMKDFDKIGKDLDSAAFVNSAGKAVGSNTVQNFSTGKILGGVINKAPVNSPALALITKPLQWLYAVPEAELQDLMLDAMLDPRIAATLLRKARPKEVFDVANALKERAVAVGIGVGETEATRGEQ